MQAFCMAGGIIGAVVAVAVVAVLAIFLLRRRKRNSDIQTAFATQRSESGGNVPVCKAFLAMLPQY